MLMKLCSCGRRIPQGQICECKKSRHWEYDNNQRDVRKKKFYSSVEWRKISSLVKARANGLDEYQLALNGKIIAGAIAHHIYTVDDRPDLQASLENLIFVSASTHNMIHAEYDRDIESRRAMQKILWGIRHSLPLMGAKLF